MKNDPLTHYIPRRLDDPPKFLFWDYDIAMIALFGFVVGIWAGLLWVGIAFGFAGAAGYGKLKSGKHPGMAVHISYWFFGLPQMKRIPQSHIRVVIG